MLICDPKPKNVWMSDKSWEPGMFWKTWKTFTLATFATFTTFATYATFTLSFTLSRHAEQLLFSCLCSKVTLTLFHFHYFRRFHYFHNFHPLIQSLSTCWTSFVFISMLKTHCLLLKIAMLFFGPHGFAFFFDKTFHLCFFGTTSAPSPVSLEVIELVPR